jgi:hypothetical protein
LYALSKSLEPILK